MLKLLKITTAFVVFCVVMDIYFFFLKHEHLVLILLSKELFGPGVTNNRKNNIIFSSYGFINFLPLPKKTTTKKHELIEKLIEIWLICTFAKKKMLTRI